MLFLEVTKMVFWHFDSIFSCVKKGTYYLVYRLMATKPSQSIQQLTFLGNVAPQSFPMLRSMFSHAIKTGKNRHSST